MPGFPITYDNMLAMPRGTVIEPIPSDELASFHLRAASIGSLAINLGWGVNRINVGNNLTTYVAAQTDDPERQHNALRLVRIHGQALAFDGLPQQFNEAERAELSRLVGRTVTSAPAIVLGIRPDMVQLRYNHAGQPILTEQIPFAAVDPYSQQELSKIFGVDVAALPLTPGKQGPEYPPADIPTLGGE